MIGPFKSIVDRPYDQAALKEFDWSRVKPELVHFSEINLTQSHLNIEGLLGKQYSGDPYPRLIEWKGEYYLEDGHHRLVMQAAVDRVYTAAWCRVLLLDNARQLQTICARELEKRNRAGAPQCSQHPLWEAMHWSLSRIRWECHSGWTGSGNGREGLEPCRIYETA